jgi:hypothetical protein
MFLSGGDYYPRKWANMSLDMRLFYVLFGVGMGCFMLGGSGALPGFLQVGVLAIGLLVMAGISIANRRRKGWRWRGVRLPQIFGALLGAGAAGLMLFVSWPMAGAMVDRIAAWFAMIVLIGLFNALSSLGIVRQSQDAFEADCRDAAPEASAQPDLIAEAPRADWRVWVRRLWVTLFVLVWLSGMAFFYFQFREQPGATPAINPLDGTLPGLLTAFWMGGTFFVLISGFVLHYIFRIRVLPNTPLPGEPRR